MALHLTEAPRAAARAASIESSLAVLQGAGPLPARQRQLLQQWRAEIDSRPALQAQPLRTLHHFACTGGTLIAKCIAALPNVQLLSEVDPLSRYLADGAPRFVPTDMVALLRQSSRGADQGLVIELFQAQMRVLHADATRRGWALVVRDHAHSHFCEGADVPERPGLRQLMPPELPVLSLLTVRHPLDSLASLAANDWLHFEPRSVDEYSGRYHRFLDHHAGVPVLRYEDFVVAPEPAMQRICQTLQLGFQPRFAELFAGFGLSGDSGRSGATIAPRPSQPRAVALEAEAARSEAYRTLVARLGYGQGAGQVDP
jgi:hypothetical protein